MRWKLPGRKKATLLLSLLLVNSAGGFAANAGGEVTERDGVRIYFQAAISPRALPRHGEAPLRVMLAAKFAAEEGAVPPQLQQISLAINRHGHFNPGGLPVCRLGEIQPATASAALQACRGSLVGTGSFTAKVLLPQQAPFPSVGRIFAFSGRYRGAPAILAHVYGTRPVPTSFTLPFTLHPAHGAYGTLLTASLPNVTSQWGYVTGIELSLGRRFRSGGSTRSYLTGSCPAPPGFSQLPFHLARGTYRFAGGREVHLTVTHSCRARG